MRPAFGVHQLRWNVDAERRHTLRPNRPQSEIFANTWPGEDGVKVVRQINLAHLQRVALINYDEREGVTTGVFYGQVEEEHITRPAVDDKSQQAARLRQREKPQRKLRPHRRENRHLCLVQTRERRRVLIICRHLATAMQRRRSRGHQWIRQRLETSLQISR